MRARETAFYVATLLLSKALDSNASIKFFSLFTFQGRGQRILDPVVRKWLRSRGIPIYGASVFFLLVVNFIWAAISGRLFPEGRPEIYNYLEDWPNLLNYSVVGPIYFTFGICFLVHIFDLRKSLEDSGLFPALRIGDIQERGTPFKYGLSGLILFSSAFTVALYASELPKYGYQFWFQTLSPGGEKILSAHGYYYLIANLLMNLVMVAVIACHFEVFAVAAIIGRKLRDMLKDKNVDRALFDKGKLVQLFEPFSSLYLVSKVLVVAVIINLYTWKSQDPNFIGLLDFTVVLAALLGFAAVSYPRYHIQGWIFKLWKEHDIDGYPEIRRSLTIGLASLADVLILGGAMTNLVIYVLKKAGIDIKLMSLF